MKKELQLQKTGQGLKNTHRISKTKFFCTATNLKLGQLSILKFSICLFILLSTAFIHTVHAQRGYSYKRPANKPHFHKGYSNYKGYNHKGIKYGGSINKTVTGSGLQTILNPAGSIHLENFSFEAGPTIKNKEYKITGGHLEFRYLPTMHGANASIFFHYTSLLNYRTTLHKTGELDNLVHYNEMLDKRVSSFENFIGFGLEKGITSNCFLSASIGVGAFHLRFSDGSSSTTPSLMLKTSLNFRGR